MDNIINSYPYTDFHELNLDYILSILHATEDHVTELNNEISLLVKDVEIIANATLKVTFQNGAVKTYALPSGSNFVFDVYDKEDSTNILELDVDEESYYDTNGDMTVFSDVLFSGIPFTMRYRPTGSTGVIALVVPIIAAYGPQFFIYDTSDDAHKTWKAFQAGWGYVDGVQTFSVTRIY